MRKVGEELKKALEGFAVPTASGTTGEKGVAGEGIQKPSEKAVEPSENERRRREDHFRETEKKLAVAEAKIALLEPLVGQRAAFAPQVPKPSSSGRRGGTASGTVGEA